MHHFLEEEQKKNTECDEYSKSKSYKYDSTQYPRYTAILGGGNYKNSTEDLKGLVAEAILGGLEIDLREAKITEDIVLELTAVLGGIDVFIPDNVRVEIISGVPILGGFEHKINRNVTSGPKVRIKYTAVLGGIEIK
ncbi:hypothetical protein [Clostridium cuniculi]|uniref:hypothetical protein n=1 Tax=Clostridium cuniculi TaxID=2548455 RepID=UPI0010547C52|nr:hypothetical protein [Clostridium cuniculi]